MQSFAEEVEQPDAIAKVCDALQASDCWEGVVMRPESPA
jgi:hypothetical protein